MAEQKISWANISPDAAELLGHSGRGGLYLRSVELLQWLDMCIEEGMTVAQIRDKLAACRIEILEEITGNKLT